MLTKAYPIRNMIKYQVNPTDPGAMKYVDRDEAIISLVGAVIRQAIRDCFSPSPAIKRDAHDFIFSHRIEIFLDKYGVERMIAVSFIRKIVSEGKRDYFLHNEHYMSTKKEEECHV